MRYHMQYLGAELELPERFFLTSEKGKAAGGR